MRNVCFFYETLLTTIVHNNFQVSDLFFSYEAHFNLHGNVNRQNMRYYFETNPDKLLHSPVLLYGVP